MADIEPLTILDATIVEYSPVAVVGLFSGGNDSTVLIDVVRARLTHLAHVNTGIGVEQTREYVRRMSCDYFRLPFIEEHPPEGCTYEEIVLRWGFPGPGGHRVAYNRLKERALRNVRKRFITNGRKQRILFVTGVRRQESQRRMPLQNAVQREGSVVWCNPLFDWTNDDITQYRTDHPELPRNEVADLLHHSGECLCGAFARPTELAEIEFFFPETGAEIRELERRVEAAGIKACKWGQRPPKLDVEDAAPGPLCSGCAE